jgi:hypothetical protein
LSPRARWPAIPRRDDCWGVLWDVLRPLRMHDFSSGF